MPASPAQTASFSIATRPLSIDAKVEVTPSGLLAIAPGAMMVADPLPDIAVPTLWIGIGNLIFGMLQVPVASRLRRLR